MKLEQTYPDYQSKYSMVTFNEDIPFAKAMLKGRAQDEKLMEICSQKDTVDDVIIEKVYEDLKTIFY